MKVEHRATPDGVEVTLASVTRHDVYNLRNLVRRLSLAGIPYAPPGVPSENESTDINISLTFTVPNA
jgi:hypothetical protein